MKKDGLHQRSNFLSASSLPINFRQAGENTVATSNSLAFHYSR